MAETARLINSILTLLADNTNGNISPEDVRDSVISLFPDYGLMYNNAQLNVSPLDTLTYTWCMSPTVTTLVLGQNFQKETGTGGLQYKGVSSIRNLLLFASLSFFTPSATQNLEFRLQKGTSTDIAHTHQRYYTDAVSDREANVALFGMSAAPLVDDFFSVGVRNFTSLTQISVTNLVIGAIALPKYS